MKTLLINAPIIRDKSHYIDGDNYFPQGLLYLASVLKENNQEVSIWDANNFYENNLRNFDLEDIYENIKIKLNTKLEDFKPNLVGIGCMFSGAFQGLKMIAKQVKQKNPKIPVSIGGIHPTIFPKEILKKYEEIDYVSIGESEDNLINLIREIENGNLTPKNLEGIAFRDNREIILNPKTKFIENLDKLPFPDYNLLDINDYKKDTSKWHNPKNLKISQPFPIITSRSCPNQCNFCSMWMVHGKKIRFRTPENVLDQMEDLYDKGVNYFQFQDDNLTWDKERIIKICEGINERGMNIQYGTPNGVAINKLDKDIIGSMVGAGLVRVSLAIESGSDFIRNKVMKKRLKTEKIYEVVEECANHKNLFINGFFVVGMPQETHETLEETYQMIQRLPLNKFAIFFATPYPGTELFNYCIEHDLLSNRTEDYMEMGNLQCKSNEPHFKPHALTKEDLINFRKKCYDYQERILKIQNFPR